MGIGVFFPRVKQLGREVNHVPPSCAELNNEWWYTFTPSMGLHVVTSEIFALVYFYHSKFSASNN
jgi:hypothetical protein